jgi:hypothetical protein
MERARETGAPRLNGWERLMTGYPCIVILICFVFLISIHQTANAAGRTAKDTTDSNFEARNWRENQANGALRWMKANLEDEEAEDEDEEEEEDEEKFRFDASETIFFIWERCPPDVAASDCDFDIFSDEALEEIAKVESMLASWDKWEEKYCTLHENNKNKTHARCMAPLSFMNFVHKDPVQVEKLLDTTDKGEDAIEGEFDFFGALCLPMTKAVSTETMYDVSGLAKPAEGETESDCVPEGATTTSAPTQAAAGGAAAYPQGCLLSDACFQEGQDGSPVDQATCEDFGGTWGCVPGCEHPAQAGVCFTEQGGVPLDKATCESFGATWSCVQGCEHPGQPGVCFNELPQGGGPVSPAICEDASFGGAWGCKMSFGTPAPTPAMTCADVPVPFVSDKPASVSFDPDKKGVGFIQLGLPPCESQAYYWWKGDFEKGAGTETIDHMCGISDDTKDAVADLISGSSMELDLSSMGMPLTCPVAMGELPGDMAAVAPVFAVFPLIKRDLIISSDLVEDPAESAYECNADKQAGLLRSMYFAGVDTTKENPEGNGTSKHLLGYLEDLWERCEEINKELSPLNERFYGKFRGGLVCGTRWVFSQFMDLLQNDINMVLGSMSSCLILMSLRCDFLPAFAAIMQIVMSIVAAIVTWGVLGFENVTTFHNFLFFIIMGIGAAACFVLYDAFLQEKLLHHDEPDHVVFSRAYRRAVPAILLTSCTTMMGFLSAGASGIMGIKTFGYFASLVIIFDFFFAITLFAATFYFCETTMKKYPIQWLFGGIVIGLIFTLVGYLNGVFQAGWTSTDVCTESECVSGAGIGFVVGFLLGAFVGDSSIPPRRYVAKQIANLFSGLAAEGKSDLGEELGPIELFCNGPFYRFLKKFGLALLALYLLFTAGMFATAALYLDTSRDSPPFLPRDHPIQAWITSLTKFGTGADGTKDHVTLIFGLGKESVGAFSREPEPFGPSTGSPPTAPVAAYQETDEDGNIKSIDPDDPNTLPEPIFGGSDVLLDKDLQRQIWDKCEEAMERKFVAHKDGKDCKIETVSGVNVFMTPCRPGVTCFMQPLKEFIKHFGEGKLGYDWPPGKDLTEALESVASLGAHADDYANFTTRLKDEHAKRKSCDSELEFKWKMIESDPTYKPGFQGEYGFLQKYLEFQQVIGDGFYDISTWKDFRAASGWFMEDDVLKAMWIRYNATIGTLQPMSYVEPIFEKWNEYVLEFDKGIPVHASNPWGWYIIQTEMVQGVVSSIFACAILSWIVLAIGTANWMLATFAVFTIMSIITQVMGTLVWFNNPVYKIGPGSLGIIETIGASIAVGMSVDYTVHIVNAYNNCPQKDRDSRIRYSMTLMGISITLGMIATNIAAGFLLLCLIKFFTGFGQFIVMTIFYSWLSAFFILCPLLMLIGPEGSAGEIGPLKGLWGDSAMHGNDMVMTIRPDSKEVRTISAGADDVADSENEYEI